MGMAKVLYGMYLDGAFEFYEMQQVGASSTHIIRVAPAGDRANVIEASGTDLDEVSADVLAKLETIGIRPPRLP